MPIRSAAADPRGLWYKRPKTLDDAYANVLRAQEFGGEESLMRSQTLIEYNGTLQALTNNTHLQWTPVT